MRAWLMAGVVLAGAPSVGAVDGSIVRVVWSDPLDAAPSAFPAAAEEGARIFRAAGIESSWREEAGRAIGPEEIHVVILPRDRTGRTAMGSTPRTGVRAAWIFVDAVARGLSPWGARRRPSDAGALAVALGRVAVHELMHTLLPDLPHAEDGVMRASLGRRDLHGRDLVIDRRSAAALRARLLPRTQVAVAAP